MLEFEAGKLFISITGLSNAGHGLNPSQAWGIPDSNHDELKQKIDYVCAELNRLGLLFALSSANELRNIIHNECSRGTTVDGAPGTYTIFAPLAFGRYLHYSADMVNRFKDEIAIKQVYIIAPHAAAYFTNISYVFSQRAVNAFSSAEHDMSEAAKCFALERYTASVFHSMRILEVGLNELGRELNVAVAQNWNSAINSIEREIRSRSVATHGPSWREDEPFFTEAATHFRMVKNAWRNHTMHVKATYDEARAKSVLNSVGDFMNHLSSRIEEE
jgi:hypothetical protein